eukprot:114239-Rhodomonas_salina.1
MPWNELASQFYSATHIGMWVYQPRTDLAKPRAALAPVLTSRMVRQQLQWDPYYKCSGSFMLTGGRQTVTPPFCRELCGEIGSVAFVCAPSDAMRCANSQMPMLLTQALAEDLAEHHSAEAMRT